MFKLYPLIGRNSELSRDNKVLLFTAVMRPILAYGGPVWGYAAKTNINILDTLQNSTIRMILVRKENGDCKTELAVGTMWNLKQEPALITDPISDLLDIMIVQFRNEKVSNHGSIPITIDCNVVAFIVFEEVRTNEPIPPAHKALQTVGFSGCNGVSTYTCGLASLQMRQFCLLT
ncbi:hypothetical protein TNCV_1678321 [Trichonephila clavipes]|nr:hypothetical protein TNCV_1678321 [Trichonephila clavipes]